MYRLHVLLRSILGTLLRRWSVHTDACHLPQLTLTAPVNAIIFMCSTCGFNEVLDEDRAVNRLLDSFTLWKTVCASKLLSTAQFILLLNKTDILAARLRSGIQFGSYVKSYKDTNDPVQVIDCEYPLYRGPSAPLSRVDDRPPEEVHRNAPPPFASTATTTCAQNMRYRHRWDFSRLKSKYVPYRQPSSTSPHDCGLVRDTILVKSLEATHII